MTITILKIYLLLTKIRTDAIQLKSGTLKWF